jgi:DNA-binding GntR family transcriptional regulator
VSSAAATVPELTRVSLREQVRSVLRTQIITGQIEADRLYSVGEFAAILGVSATPVREALGDLEQHGLVQIIRNRGFRVPPLTEHDLDEIFQLRLMIEVAAIEKLVGLVEPEHLVQYEAFVDSCEACAASRDLAGFLEADRAFHLCLLRTLGNERLVEIVDRLRDQSRLYGLTTLASESLVASAAEHRELLQAIVAKDRKRARAQMIKHLEHTRGLWARRPG